MPIAVLEKLKLESIIFNFSVPIKDARNLVTRDFLQKKSSIYLFIDIERGMTYIGSAINTTKRLGEHFNPIVANRKRVSNVRFQNALAKYGPESFVLAISEFVPKLKDEENKTFTDRLISREQAYIDLVPFKFQYNIASKAGSKAGSIASLETRQKMSIASKGRPKSEEMKARLSATVKGVPKTLAGRANMSYAQLNIPTETRARMNKALIAAKGSPVRLSNQEKKISFEAPSIRQAVIILESHGTKTVFSTLQAKSKNGKLFKGWKVELLPQL